MIFGSRGTCAALTLLAAVPAALAWSGKARRKEMRKCLFRLVALAVPLAAFLMVAASASAQPTPPTFQPQKTYKVGTGPGTGVCGDQPGELCPFDIKTADFDGDGNFDLVTANRFGAGNDDISVFRNDGSGNFGTPSNFGSTVSTLAVGVGKFTSSSSNPNPNPDVVVVDPDTSPTGSVWVFPNQSTSSHISFGTPKPTPVPTATTLGVDPTDLTVDDFDRDGKLDVAVANNQSGNVTVLKGNGDGTFAPTPLATLTQSFPLGINSGDFDGKNGPDLAVTSCNFVGATCGTNTVSIYLNDGSGNFFLNQVVAAGSGPAQVVVDDLNGDGKRDIAVSNFDSDNVSVALGNGNGTLQGAASFAAGDGPYHLRACLVRLTLPSPTASVSGGSWPPR